MVVATRDRGGRTGGKALVQAAGRRGLVLLSCGVYSNVIRFLMPLTIPDAELAEGLAILEAALEDVSR